MMTEKNTDKRSGACGTLPLGQMMGFLFAGFAPRGNDDDQSEEEGE